MRDDRVASVDGSGGGVRAGAGSDSAGGVRNGEVAGGSPTAGVSVAADTGADTGADSTPDPIGSASA